MMGNDELVSCCVKRPRERIIEMAQLLFRKHGIRGVGVDAIAEEAGTNKMTLYRHFGSKDELIAECLRETGLPASCLHLELTETAVISDELQAAAMLARLHSTGVKVWLDDFGTGFSGLSHLRRVPVDGVKIDRSFVADLQRDPDDLALTTAIIAMAHSLGITVVAEGVEKEAQYNLLAERGCDLVQGYWLSHPISATEFAHLLARRGR